MTCIFYKIKIRKGLNEFGHDYTEAKLYLLNLGTHKEYHSNVDVIPFEEALRNLPQILA